MIATTTRVAEKSMQGDFMRLVLQPHGALLRHTPGQYLKVVLTNGKRRPFSIANAPTADGVIELHVRRVNGGDFSEWVFGAMAVGDTLHVEGPFGMLAPPDGSGRPALLIAGGTGFAPMKAIIEHLLHEDASRPIALYWGAKLRDDLYDHALALCWARDHPRFRYVPVLSDESSPYLRTGLVHEVALRDYPDLRSHEVYLSGPAPMVRAALASLSGTGLPAERLHYDLYEEPTATPAPVAAAIAL